MTARNIDWYLAEENEAHFTALTTAQLDILMKDGTVDLDDIPSGKSIAPSDDAGKKDGDVVKDVVPVVLAKDGVHTIPYAELEASRARTLELETVTANQAKIIAEFEAAKVADAKAETTVATDKLIEKLQAEYPEISDTLVPLLKSLSGADKVDALEKEVSALRKQNELSSTELHYSLIEEAHPDYGDIFDSGTLHKWIESLPTYAREGASQVLKEGTAAQVIELYSNYKQANGLTGDTEKPASKEQIELAARAAVEKARHKGAVPSLNDIPAAGSGATTEQPTTLQGWRSKFDGMTEKEALAELNR